jgi:hypothetical protein
MYSSFITAARSYKGSKGNPCKNPGKDPSKQAPAKEAKAIHG